MRKFDYNIVSNPEIFHEHRLPAHSDHRFSGPDGDASRLRTSLNGSWKFSYADSYAEADPSICEADYDITDLPEIRVPGHIQLQGYDRPAYINTQWPWDGHEDIRPGEVPTRFNPTASYIRDFDLPASFAGHEVHIIFHGAESGLALWLNGVYIGYSEDSFTPSEFDLTPFLREGKNRLAVQVFKWTAGSWCESQDFFRFSGIFRDVELVALPALHVRDLRIRTLLDENFSSAELSISLDVNAAARVRFTLSGGLLCEERQLQAGVNAFSFHIPNPELWSAEKPVLYTLSLTVCGEDGEPVELLEEQVGFRRFEIRDSVMYLNGQRIVFRGVNRHEFCSEGGRCISEAIIRQDLVTMKRNNINAVRTSHYPNRTEFYRLCDELGLYVIDETNMETHASWDAAERGLLPLEEVVPGDRPEFLGLTLDRARSMVERDKNHPCILIWSCGNEAFGGRNLFEMSELIRELDPTRPIQYEGLYHDRRYPATSDIESTMYIPASEIRSFLKEHRDKPYISCEYLHAMGNSCGAMQKYTELTEEEPLYQGGFIWDYIDQTLTLTDRFGHPFEGYGGDFGDRPCDYSFSGNGIVYGRDRKPSPKMQEVRYNYQTIRTSLVLDPETGRIRAQVRNLNLFTDTEEFDCELTLAREGAVFSRCSLRIQTPPLGTTDLLLPAELPEEAGEYTATLSFRLKEDTSWAKKGHELAYSQAVLLRSAADGSAALKDTASLPLCPLPVKAEVAKPEIIRGFVNIGARGRDFEVLFSALHGGLVSYKYKGRELLKRAPRPNFWRAPTENDVANQLAFRAGQWKAASLYATHKYEHGRRDSFYEIEETDRSLIVTFTLHLPVNSSLDCRLRYEVFGDGEIEATLSMPESRSVGELPVFELLFTMEASYDRLRWYGLGPEETYPDRCHGKLGLYENHVEDNLAAYLVPQECGSKAGVRRAEVTDAEGFGLRFLSEGLQFSALPHTPEELESARHPNELPPVLSTFVRIGYQMGIGGDDTWGALVHPEFLLDNTSPLTLTFRFSGIGPS